MIEISFHDFVLSAMGAAGVLEFYGTYRLPRQWSPRRRVFLGIVAGLTYFWQAIVAFKVLSNASSLEILGFVGCVLGCLGAVRMLGGVAAASGDAEPLSDALPSPSTSKP